MNEKEVWTRIFPLRSGDRVRVRKASLYLKGHRHHFIGKTGIVTFINLEGDRVEVELDVPVRSLRYAWFLPTDLVRV